MLIQKVVQFPITFRGSARRGRKWRVVAVTSLPVGFTRLPAASAVALRHWSLPLLNTISFFRIIGINNLPQSEEREGFKKRRTHCRPPTLPQMLTNVNDPNQVINGCQTVWIRLSFSLQEQYNENYVKNTLKTL